MPGGSFMVPTLTHTCTEAFGSVATGIVTGGSASGREATGAGAPSGAGKVVPRVAMRATVSRSGRRYVVTARFTSSAVTWSSVR